MNDADAAFNLFAKFFEEVLNMSAPLEPRKIWSQSNPPGTQINLKTLEQSEIMHTKNGS